MNCASSRSDAAPGEARDLRPHRLAYPLPAAECEAEGARGFGELGLEGAGEHRGVGEAASVGDVLHGLLLVEEQIARRLQPDLEIELHRRLAVDAPAVALELADRDAELGGQCRWRQGKVKI